MLQTCRSLRLTRVQGMRTGLIAKVGVVGVILFAPGGFLLGAALAVDHLRRRRKVPESGALDPAAPLVLFPVARFDFRLFRQGTPGRAGAVEPIGAEEVEGPGKA